MIHKSQQILEIVSINLAILASSILLLFSPLWLDLAYRSPIDFIPSDLGKPERLALAQQTLAWFWFIAELPPEYRVAEINHLKDVRQIFLVVILTLIISTAYLWSSKSLEETRNWLLASYWGLGLMLSCSLTIWLNWDWFFEMFHKALFPQGNWQFYSEDLLIQLFPPQFWFTSAVTLIGLNLIVHSSLILCKRFQI